MKNIWKRIKSVFNRLIKNINRPEMRVLPGQIAFFFSIMIIPLLALIGVIVSLLDLSYVSLPDILSTYFPRGTDRVLSAISTKIPININLLIFFVTSLFLSSNGTHSMIIASNEIYKIDSKSYIRTRLKALLMVIFLIVLLVFILFIPLFGDFIFKTIALVNDPSTIKSIVIKVYNIIKYPLSILFVYIFIKNLYIIAPDKKIYRKDVTFGAVFTSIMWIIVTRVYSIYVSFTSYNSFYGSISSILILLLWIYFLSYIFVLGMAMNATKYELESEKEKEIKEEEKETKEKNSKDSASK